MKIIKLQGGLGNQMFQYAFARGLAEKTGDEVRFDYSGFSPLPGVALRSFALDAFALEAPEASPADIRDFTEEKRTPWLAALKRMFGITVPVFLQERECSFHPELWRQASKAYFEGYWQSENYFSFIASEIRTTFTPRQPLSTNGLMLSEKMRGESISLHVRRGDYVTIPKVANVLGTCEPSYYQRALSKAIEGLSEPRVFVFSDDPAWVKEHLSIPCPTTFIADYTLGDWEELILMSQCKRHIISNSSFSWWGAWLDPRQDKMVIAPARWFKDPSLENKDITPPSWVRL